MSEQRLGDLFSCPYCGASCAATQEGDLLNATCILDGRRYVLTVLSPAEAKPAASHDPLVGQTLGPCRIGEQLGFEGGLPLYQAVAVKSGRPCTVRVLAGEAAKDDKRRRAFLAAAAAAAAVDHPALAKGTRAVEFSGGLFCAQPPLAGRPIGAVVEGANRPGPRQVIEAGRVLAEALVALHEHKIIHRNIGPKTVYLLPNGAPRLRNFAFAIQAGETPADSAVVGQPGFLAPELLAGLHATERSDLYSFGALLYLALVGAPAFRGATALEVVRNQFAGAAPNRDALASVAAPELADLVLRLLAHKPQDRPASAREALDVLSRLLGLVPALELVEPPLAPGPAGELALVEPPPEAPAPSVSLAPLRPHSSAETPAAIARPGLPKATILPPGEKGEPEVEVRLALEDAPPRREATVVPMLELEPRPAAGPGRGQPAAARPGGTPRPAGAPATTARRDTRPPAVEPAGGGHDELLVEVTEQLGQAETPMPSGPLGAEPAPGRKRLAAGVAGLAALLVVLVGIFFYWRFGGEDKASRPAAPPPTSARGRGAPGKAPSEADRADAVRRAEYEALEALAKRNAKAPEETIKQCDIFLERHAGSEQATAARKLRDEALAALREKEADAAARALQAGLRERGTTHAGRLADIAAFLKKHHGTKAAAGIEKLRDQLIAEHEAAAERAAQVEKPKLDKHLAAEAFGPAMAILASLAEGYEGTRAGSAAASQLAELRARLAADLRARKEAAAQLVRQTAFTDALAQLDPPLHTWQAQDLKREAEALAAEIRERREAIVRGYGTALTDFDRLAAAWRFDEAEALAARAAAAAKDPVLAELLRGKAADAAAMLVALDRAVAGAKAEQAKAAKTGEKLWLQRASGARLKAVISEPSRTGLHAEMPGFKGPLSWAEIHPEQVVAFARGAPGELTAADLVGLGLIALQAGAPGDAFEQFTKAVELDPAALDVILAALRRHAAGFVYIPAGSFPAGPRREAVALEGYLLGRAEVTNAEFAFFAQATKAPLPPDWRPKRDDYPVASVKWTEADACARWLGMRLPTDLEWERAVRGTEGRLYPWGNTFDTAHANLGRPLAAKGPTTASALLLPARRHVSRRDDFPFYHLVGNVREWTSTPYLDARKVPTSYAVVGGAATDGEKEAAPYARAQRKPDALDPLTGFRLAWPR